MAKVIVPSNMVFERHEKKFRLTPSQHDQLLPLLLTHFTPDEYGVHSICSVYFDTDDFLLLHRALQRPRYKEKFRLRIYGEPSPSSIVYLELKKKLDGITYKRRMPLTLHEAERYLFHGERPAQGGQIFEEIDYFLHLYHPKAKIELRYERMALYGTQDNRLRVTLDRDVRWRKPGEAKDHALLPGEWLMEIKTPEAIPFWLVRMLSELHIYPVSFSKYNTACMALRKEESSIAI